MPITLADLPELIHYPVQCLGTACDRSSFIRKREVVYHSLISRLPITPLSPRVFGAHLCSVVFPLWGICTHIIGTLSKHLRRLGGGGDGRAGVG